MIAADQHDRKTIMVISLSNLANDPRLDRQIRFLHEQYHIIAVGYAPPTTPVMRFLSAHQYPPESRRIGGLRYAIQRIGKLLTTRTKTPPKSPPPSSATRTASPPHPTRNGTSPATSSTKHAPTTHTSTIENILVNTLHTMARARQLPIRCRNVLLYYGRFLLRRYETIYWQSMGYLYERLQGISCDLIVANDIITLPLALRLAEQNGAKVVFDAHEYAPRQFEDQWNQRLLRQPYRAYLCSTYIPRVDGMMTVCQGIADQYERDTGVRPVVVTNAPDYVDLAPMARPHDDPRIRMIHHGLAHPSRRIEQMITLMDYLDERFELDMLLVEVKSQEAYLAQLKQQAAKHPRIRILPPILMQQLVTFSHQYDIGLFLLEPTSFSYRHALPNKFFEFIQARLAIAIGPSPEMARIVEAHQCGVVSRDFTPQSLANCLRHLDHHQINEYKYRSHQIARSMSSAQNRELVLELVGRTLAQTPHVTSRR